MPLTPADVHNVAFSKPPIGKRGYNEDEVDAFLDLVEAELARLLEENADLREQVEQLEQRLGNAQARPRGRPAQRPPARRRRRPAPAVATPSRPVGDGSTAADASRMAAHPRCGRTRRWPTGARRRRPPRSGRQGARPGPGDGRPADRRGQDRGRRRCSSTPAPSPSSCSPRPAPSPTAWSTSPCARRDDAQRRPDQGGDAGAAVARQGSATWSARPSASRTRSSALIQRRQVRAGEEDRRAAHLRAGVPHAAQDVPGVPARDLEGRGSAAPLDGRGRTPTADTPPAGTASGPTPGADRADGGECGDPALPPTE